MDETDTESEIDFGDGGSSWFKDQEEPTVLGDIAFTPIEIKEEPLGDVNILIEIKEEPLQEKINPVTPIEVKEEQLQEQLNPLNTIEIIVEPLQEKINPVTPIEVKEEQLQEQLNPLNTIEIIVEPLEEKLNPITRIEIKKELVEKYFNAIVYTTRLDDMGVFKRDLRQATKREVTNSIFLESKPKLTKAPQDSVRKILVNFQKFNDIKEKLDEIYHKRRHICIDNSSNANTITNCRSHDAIEKLLKLCKPVSVVLQDISTVPLAQPKEKQLKINKNSRKNIEAGKHFLLWDYYSGETNIYTVNSSGHLTGYYNSKEIIKNYAFLPCNNFNITTFGICCWYQREQFIQKLVPDIVPKITANFMRNTHKCFPECFCCCRETKSKNVVVSNPASLDVNPVDDEINEIRELERQISEALSRLKGENEDRAISEEVDTNSKHPITLIDKALKYKRIQKTASLHENPISKTSDKIDTVTIKQAKKDESEFYEFRADGSALTYIKGNIRAQSVNIRAQSKAFVCCWEAREQEIEKMNIKLKSKQFLKTPHSCPLGSCVCCCKRRQECIDKSTPLPKTLPVSVTHSPNVSSFDTLGEKLATVNKRKKHVSNSSSKVKVTRSMKLEQKIQIGKTNSDANPVNVRSIPYYSLVTNSLQTEPVLESVIENNIMGISANSFIETSYTPSINNMYIPVETAFHNTNAPVTIDELNSSRQTKDDRASGTLNVDLLITTILERFKDVRLTINEDGKVAAAINTPMNTLSTAELKVLANILAHAQEQVTSLNLAPGANLNEYIEMLNNSSSDVATNDSTCFKPLTIPPTNTSTAQQENMSTLSGYLDATKLSLDIQVPESFTNNVAKTTVPLTTSSSTKTKNIVRNRSGTDKQFCSDNNMKLYQSFSKIAKLKKQYHCKSFQTYCKSIAVKDNENTSCTKTLTNSSFTHIPRIENVFSLRTVNVSPENNDNNQLGSKTSLQTAKVKRKSVESLCPIQSKIKIPSKDSTETQIVAKNAKTKQSSSKESINKSQEQDLDDECGIPKFVLVKSNDSVQTLQVEELDTFCNSKNFVGTQTVAAPQNTASFFTILPSTMTNPAQIILPQTNPVQTLQNGTINCNNKIAPNIHLENGVISLVEPNLQKNQNNNQTIQSGPILFECLRGSQSLADCNPGPLISAGNNKILPNTNLFHNPFFSNINSSNDVFLISIGESRILDTVPNESVNQISQLRGKDLLETVGKSLDMVITTNSDNANAIPNVTVSSGDNMIETIEIDDNDCEDISLVKDEIDEDEADCILGI